MYIQKIIISISLLFISIDTLAKEKLIFAVDIVRHGERTPEITIPKAQHQWPEGIGQLTARGMRQEFELGASLRKKYIHKYHLLPKYYRVDTMKVFSTDCDRTLMSAQAILLGLYPLGTGPFLPNNKPSLPNAYQPIPIYIKPFADFGKKTLLQIFEKHIFSRADWRKKNIELKDKCKRWSLATGLNIDNISWLAPLGDALSIYRLHHIPAPTGLSLKDINEIIAVGRWAFITGYQTKELANIMGQTILANIVDYLQKASSQTTPLKYVLFSGHDTTIGSIMTLLQKPLDVSPPYAANVNFALFKIDNDKYVVKTSYNGKPVIIPGCGTKICTLEQFIKIASHTK
ncbi:MAG: histidine phosphatase family protein [Gammaproteobacteria bacterium]|nr:histidine phosphatase family protein [Gammaproteobacteria bacterium]